MGYIESTAAKGIQSSEKSLYSPYPTAAIATNGAAATAAVPTAVPMAAAPEATAPTPEATAEPADVTAAPTLPKPMAEAAPPMPEAAELIELENALTALLLALEMELPIEFAPIADNAAPEPAPIVAPAVPVIAL